MGERKKLSTVNIRQTEVDDAHDVVYEYGNIVEKVVDDIVLSEVADLDNTILDIQDLLADRANIHPDDLTYYISYLPTLIYFVTDRAESVGIKSDSSSVIRKQKFDDFYLLAEGKTINDKTSETNRLVINEAIVESAYKRAYKKIQSRLEVADMMLTSLKKVLQWHMTELETSAKSYEGKGRELNARSSNRRVN